MSKEILILNGPNLNALGRREPEKYGAQSLSALKQQWQEWGEKNQCVVKAQQSNFEGELLDLLHAAEALNQFGVVLFNPGAFTHTSRALRDGIASLTIPVIEIHITNVAAREAWRKHSLLAEVCAGSIVGLGSLGYRLGLEAALEIMKECS